MLDIVKIGVVRQAIAQIDPHALPDLYRPRVPGFQFFLHEVQFFSVGQFGRDLDPGPGCQAEDSTAARNMVEPQPRSPDHSSSGASGL